MHVFSEPGGYGDFSHLDRYLAAIDWLDAQGIEYDWLENITGQDYPLRPIAEIERDLADGDVARHLLPPVFPDRTPPGADQARRQASCSAAWSARGHALPVQEVAGFGKPTPVKQRWLRPLVGLQLRRSPEVTWPFSTVGLRRRDTLFGDDFVCYGGWFFCTLPPPARGTCATSPAHNPTWSRFFRTVQAPEEVFLQTVLVNSASSASSPTPKRYIDLRGSRNNHSKTLGLADLDLGAGQRRQLGRASSTALMTRRSSTPSTAACGAPRGAR